MLSIAISHTFPILAHKPYTYHNEERPVNHTNYYRRNGRKRTT